MLTGLCVNLPMNYGLTVNLMGDEGLGLCIMTSTNRRPQNRCSKSTSQNQRHKLANTGRRSHSVPWMRPRCGAELREILHVPICSEVALLRTMGVR